MDLTSRDCLTSHCSFRAVKCIFFSVEFEELLNNKVTKYVNVVGMIDSNILGKVGFGKMIGSILIVFDVS